MSQKRTSRSDRVLHEELEDSKPPAVTRTYTVTPDMKSPPAANSSSQKDIERQLPPRTGRKRTTESPATRTTRASATRLALEEEDHDDDDRPLQPERKNTTRISPDSETPYSGLRSRRSFSSSDTSFGSVPVPPSLSYQQTEPISNTTNALAAGAAAGGGSKGKTSPPVPPPLPVERPSIADTMEDSLLPRTDSTIDDTTLSSRSNSSVTNSTMNTLDLVLAQRYAGYYEHLPTTEDQVVVEEDGDNLTTESLHSSVTQSTQNTLDLVLTKRYAAFYGEQNGTKEDQRKTRKPTMAPQAPLENGKARGDRGEDTATQLLLDEKRRQAGGYISRDLDQYKSAERPSQDCSGWVNVNAHHNTVRMDDDDGFNDETSHDESLSTTPDPPSLRVRDHYVRPGAYRMRQGGVARHVDNDSVVSSSLRTISTLRTNLGLGIIEASLVPDDIVPKGEPDTDSKKDSNSNQQYIATNDGTYNDDDGDDDCECPSAPAPPTYATSGGGQTFLTSSTASPVVQAQPLDDGHTIRAFFNKKSIRCLILLFTVIFVLLALGAVYAVTGFVFDDMRKSQGGQNDAYSPDGDGVTASSAPTTSPTSQGDLDLEYFVRAILPEYTKESLTRSNSPQTKALQWLQNNTHLESYPISRRLQRFALASLYFSTGGKKRWTKDFGWLSDEDECTWFSTERDLAVCRESEYKVLSLQANGLQGTIVPEISLLSSLEFVRMGKNILTGFLPTTLGSLSGLRELRLFDNFLSGVVVSELGSLTQLEILDLEYNFLAQILPSSLGQLENLEQLLLDRNVIVGTLRSEYGNLQNLEAFFLYDNLLSGSIPFELGNLSQLQQVELDMNTLSGPIPTSIGQWGSLKSLNLGNNTLSGAIPSEIGLLKELTHLDFFKNSLESAVPSEIGLLTKLEMLYLEVNNFSGPVPSELGLLTNAKRVWLHDTQLTGTMPEEVCNLVLQFGLHPQNLTVNCSMVECTCCTCR